MSSLSSLVVAGAFIAWYEYLASSFYDFVIWQQDNVALEVGLGAEWRLFTSRVLGVGRWPRSSFARTECHDTPGGVQAPNHSFFASFLFKAMRLNGGGYHVIPRTATPPLSSVNS